MRLRGEPQSDVRVHLLREFQVEVSSRTISAAGWRLRKAWHLVALLALEPSQALHRERLMDLLWPDSGRDAAGRNLRYALYVARRMLDAPANGILPQSGEILRLADGEAWVDVATFRALASVARRSRATDAIAAALEAYPGDLLPEEPYAAWTIAPRDELADLWRSLRFDQAAALEAGGRIGEAIEALERLAGDSPEREDVAVALMRLYAHADQRPRALQRYELLRDTLRREVGADPDLAVRRLRDDISAGRPVMPGAGRSRKPSGNLPAQATSFVGRERELAEAERLLADARLLTLTGAAGCGKTRLALAVAERAASGLPDGAWLVELAGLRDPGLVSPAISAAVDAREGARHDPVSLLRERRALLIVDNCEHLRTGVAEALARILRGCAGVRVIATSRETIGIAGEALLEVSQLEPGAARLLFAERARAAAPGFAVSDANAATVDRICERLDRLPLPIELAASRSRALPLERILARLDDRFALLAGTDVSRPERHRTLRAAIDWSHEQLGASERLLFARLGAFRDGWRLEAAEAVAADEGLLGMAAIADILSRLVDRSLVAVRATADGAVRYRLLETLREFARERLRERGEEPERADRHLSYYVSLAERAEPALVGPEQIAWLDRLDEEHDELREALRFALTTADAHRAQRLAAALRFFWLTRGHFDEGQRALADALALDGRETLERARTLVATATLAERREDLAAAQRASEEALAIHRAIGDRAGVASVSQNIGRLRIAQRDEVTGRGLIEDALAIQREIGDRHAVASSLSALAELARRQGETDRARALFEECLVIQREVGSPSAVAKVLFALGRIAHLAGRADPARAAYGESLALLRAVADDATAAYLLANLALLAVEAGDPARAADLYREAIPWFRTARDAEGEALLLDDAAMVAATVGAHERAHRLAGAARSHRRAKGLARGPVREAALARWLADAKATLEPALAVRWQEQGERLPHAAALAEAVDVLTGEAQTPR